MYADLAVFSDTDTVTETVAAIRLLCLPRGRVRIFVPEGSRDIDRERFLLAESAGNGVHVSLASLDPATVGYQAATRIAPSCQAISVIRPDGAPLGLGVLERTLLKCSPVPVWFWNSRSTAELGIVVAGDPDPQDARRDGLNQDAVDLAADLALRARGTVVIANGWQLDGEHDLRFSPFLRVTEQEVETLREDIQTARARWIGNLAARCRARGVAVQTELREGPADRVIPVLLAESKASVLVVGTMKRRGFAALVRPNTGVRLASGFSGTIAVVPPRDSAIETGGGRLSRIAAGVAFA